MYEYEYKDYPKDGELRKIRVEAGSGIVGCEMNEKNGWLKSMKRPLKTKGRLKTFFSLFFTFKSEE